VGIVQKNSSWQAKQSVLHTAVTFYGDYMKMCKDFALKYGNKKLAVRHDNTLSHTSFFTRKLLAKSNMTIFPHLPYFV
jgi:hypothetical protein